MPRVGFEHTIPAFELAKMVHALDCAATVIGGVFLLCRPSAILVERMLADSCARSWRPNDCRGTCAHIQFRVVQNYTNEQSISRSFRHFYRPIGVGVEFCDSMVKACCVLHNYVRQKEGIHFMDTVYECPLESIPPYGVRGNIWNQN
jgi:hypothetical protein